MNRPTVTICGLGPGGLDRVTGATTAAIERAPVRFLRTRRHPSASIVGPDAVSFDDLYDRASSFDALYRDIADSIVAAALDVYADDGGLGGEEAPGVLYAVPGSPLVLEASVRHLRADDRIDVELVPALSFLDEAWARLGVDPIEESVRLVDAYRFVEQAAGERGPLLVAHAHDRLLLSDIKLAIDAGPEQRAIVLQGLGTPDESIVEVAWPDLDRVVDPDHLTSLYLPHVAAPVGQELVRSVELMRRLRRDCPWDREQDHRTLRPYLVEEAYEVLDAIDGVVANGPADEATVVVAGADLADEAYADLLEELGDLWFQILFHAELATEVGQFTIADVASGLHEKMVRRHPHVFDPVTGEHDGDAASAEVAWDRLKGQEKARASAMDGIPSQLPALALTAKILGRAGRQGVDPGVTVSDEVDRLVEGMDGSLDEASVGRLLLVVVEAARRHDIDAEDALRRAARAAADRFRAAEAAGRTPGSGWVLG